MRKIIAIFAIIGVLGSSGCDPTGSRPQANHTTPTAEASTPTTMGGAENDDQGELQIPAEALPPSCATEDDFKKAFAAEAAYYKGLDPKRLELKSEIVCGDILAVAKMGAIKPIIPTDGFLIIRWRYGARTIQNISRSDADKRWEVMMARDHPDDICSPRYNPQEVIDWLRTQGECTNR